MSPLQSLNPDCLLNIFQFCTLPSIHSLYLTNSHIQTHCDETLFRVLGRKTLPVGLEKGIMVAREVPESDEMLPGRIIPPKMQPTHKERFVRHHQYRYAWQHMNYKHTELEAHTASVLMCKPLPVYLGRQWLMTMLTADLHGNILQWDCITKRNSKILPFHQTPIVNLCTSVFARVKEVDNDIDAAQKVQYEYCSVFASCDRGNSVDGSGAHICIYDVISQVVLLDLYLPQIAPVRAFEFVQNRWLCVALGAELLVYGLDATLTSAELRCRKDLDGGIIACIALIEVLDPQLHSDESTPTTPMPNFDTPNPPILIVGTEDGHIIGVDLQSTKISHRCTDFSVGITSIATCADSNLFATGSLDCCVRLWSARTFERLCEMYGHSSSINCVAFNERYSTNSRTCLVSGSSDKTACLWDVTDYASAQDQSLSSSSQTSNNSPITVSLATLKNVHAGSINTCYLDDNVVLLAGTDKSVSIWDSQSFQLLQHVESLTLGKISSIQVVDKRYMMITSVDCSVHMFDFAPPEGIWSEPADASMQHSQSDTLQYDPEKQTYLSPPPGWRIENPTYNLHPRRTAIDNNDPVYRDKAWVIDNVLSPEECQHFIRCTEELKYEDCLGFNKEYRNNTRVIVIDEKLSELIMERVGKLLPQSITYKGSLWKLHSVGEKWRFCKYTAPGQYFKGHTDGDFQRNSTEKSFYTIMMYLNDVDQEEGEHGATRFLTGYQGEVTHRVVPKTGLCLCFLHELFHDGEELHRGLKYLMRSNVMYKKQITREIPPYSLHLSEEDKRMLQKHPHTLDRPLTKQELDHLDEHGYMVLKNLFSPEFCDSFQEELFEALRKYNHVDRSNPETYPHSLQFASLWHLKHFYALRESPQLYSVFAQLLKTPQLMATLDRIGVKPPHPREEQRQQRARHNTELELHHDVNIWNIHPDAVQYQGGLCLEDCPAGGGGFFCIPGFHREDKMQAYRAKVERDEFGMEMVPPEQRSFNTFLDGEYAKREMREIPMEKGDYILWDSRLPHNGGHNAGSNWRLHAFVHMKPLGGMHCTPEMLYNTLRLRDGTREAYETGAVPQMFSMFVPTYGMANLEKDEYVPVELTDLGQKLIGVLEWE